MPSSLSYSESPTVRCRCPTRCDAVAVRLQPRPGRLQSSARSPPPPARTPLLFPLIPSASSRCQTSLFRSLASFPILGHESARGRPCSSAPSNCTFTLIRRPLPLKRITSKIRLIAQKPPSSASRPLRSCATAADAATLRARFLAVAALSPLMRVRAHPDWLLRRP
eukprot:1926260-Prymnesium_polylepis.1